MRVACAVTFIDPVGRASELIVRIPVLCTTALELSLALILLSVLVIRTTQTRFQRKADHRLDELGIRRDSNYVAGLVSDRFS